MVHEICVEKINNAFYIVWTRRGKRVAEVSIALFLNVDTQLILLNYIH